jgi:Kdo2-lipid IVA lauroyltransferase/acyltransferase
VLHRLEYFLIRILLWPLAILPFSDAVRLARLYLSLWDLISPRWRRVALSNLELTGFPAEHQALVNSCYESLARVLALLPRLAGLTRQQAAQLIDYEGLEHYQVAKATGRGILIATAHLGNWELSVVAHALLTEPMHMVVRPLDNPLLDQWITNIRTSGGNRVHPKRKATRAIIEALRANQAVGILIDQNVSSSEAIFVNFLGHPASAQPAFARLANHTGAAILLGFTVWNPAKSKYQLIFRPVEGIGPDEFATTQAVQLALESAVREWPDQWLWFHRRWKNQPPQK